TDRGFTVQSNSAYLNVTNAATTLEFGGNIVGAGHLRKEGAGTLVLSGANTYAGTTFVVGGTLRAGVNNAFGPGVMAMHDVAGATLDLDGFDTQVGYIYGGGALGGN